MALAGGGLPASQRYTLRESAPTAFERMGAGLVVTAEADGEKVEYGSAGALPDPPGPVEQLRFEIGSITKVFTGLLLAIAVEEKRVRLDTPISEILDDQVFADPDVAKITLLQLATHTSGLPRLPGNLSERAEPANPYAHYDESMLRAALAGETLPEEGPHPESYSNYGFGLLGFLLARIYGMSWEELIREKIAEPLGLKATGVEVEMGSEGRLLPGFSDQAPAAAWDFQSLSGAGALRSDASDLVRFGRALIAPDATPLAPAIRRMLEPHHDGQGLGIRLLRVDGQPAYEHAGGTGGYRSLLRVTPAQDRVQVILSNNAAFEPAKLFVAARGERPRKYESGKVLSPPELQPYVGVYPLGPTARFTVLRDGKRLLLRLTGQPFSEIFPAEESDRFFLKVVPAEVQFEREGDAIRSLVLHQNGVEQRAPKSAEEVPEYRFPSPAALDRYVGEYAFPPALRFRVKRVGETLFIKLNDQPFLPVFMIAEDHFEYDAVEARVTFGRDDAGRVGTLTLQQNGMTIPAGRLETREEPAQADSPEE